MATTQTTIRMSDATKARLEILAEHYNSQTEVFAIAINRLYEAEMEVSDIMSKSAKLRIKNGSRVFAYPVSELNGALYKNDAERRADTGEGTVVDQGHDALHGQWYKIHMDDGRIVERMRFELCHLLS